MSVLPGLELCILSAVFDHILSWSGCFVEDFTMPERSITETCRILEDDVGGLIDSLQINHSQCQYLAQKFKEAAQVLRDYVEPNLGYIISKPAWQNLLEEIYQVALKGKLLVAACCEEQWIEAAVLLGDPIEDFSNLHVELGVTVNLFSKAFGKDEDFYIATKSRTLNEILWEQLIPKESEQVTLQRSAHADRDMLLLKLEAHFQSSRDKLKEDGLDRLAKSLERRLRDGHQILMSSRFDKSCVVYDNGSTSMRMSFDSFESSSCLEEDMLDDATTEKFDSDTPHSVKAVFESKLDASISATLSHPNVISFACLRPGACGLPLNLKDDLLNWLRSHQTLESPVDQAVDIMLQIAGGMAYLHRIGLAHRDLKAPNIHADSWDTFLSVKMSDLGMAKVRDFGMAKLFIESTTSREPEYQISTPNIGTTTYRAPELLCQGDNVRRRGRLDISDAEENFMKAYFSTDVFMYGLCCFEVLTGDSGPLSEISQVPSDHVQNWSREKVISILQCRIPHRCPWSLGALIRRCLDADPNARPSFGEIHAELMHIKYALMIGDSFPPQVSTCTSETPAPRTGNFLSDYWKQLFYKNYAESRTTTLGTIDQMGAYNVSSPHRKMESREFQTQCRLGKGESGTIYKVKWLGINFARKVFPETNSDTFKHEAAILLGLKHRNIVQSFSWSVDKRSCSLVMEIMQDDLHTFVEKRKEARLSDGNYKEELLEATSTQPSNPKSIAPFEFWEAIDVMLQVATGMKYLHDNELAHGDLKPQNILVNSENDHIVTVKVVDFGLTATKIWSMLDSCETPHMGMVRWRAPEICKVLPGHGSDDMSPYKELVDKPDAAGESQKSYDDPVREYFTFSKLGQADVYSFAMTAMEILTGQIPYSDCTLSDFRTSILSGVKYKTSFPSTCPPRLRDLLQECWNVEPEFRPTFCDICETLGAIKFALLQQGQGCQTTGKSNIDANQGHSSSSRDKKLPIVSAAQDKLQWRAPSGSLRRAMNGGCRRISSRHSKVLTKSKKKNGLLYILVKVGSAIHLRQALVGPWFPIRIWSSAGLAPICI